MPKIRRRRPSPPPRLGTVPRGIRGKGRLPPELCRADRTRRTESHRGHAGADRAGFALQDKRSVFRSGFIGCCPPASGGVARSRAARTGCGLRGSGSGAPQAGRKAVGGSEGGAGDSILGPLGGSAARSACPNPENPPQNGSFSFVADPEAPFLPILPQDLSAVAPAAKIFRSQGSKSDPVLHIQYPPAWADVVENSETGKWRRERDSNPRYRLLPVRRFSKPLLSATQPSLRAGWAIP